MSLLIYGQHRTRRRRRLAWLSYSQVPGLRRTEDNTPYLPVSRSPCTCSRAHATSSQHTAPSRTARVVPPSGESRTTNSGAPGEQSIVVISCRPCSLVTQARQTLHLDDPAHRRSPFHQGRHAQMAEELTTQRAHTARCPGPPPAHALHIKPGPRRSCGRNESFASRQALPDVRSSRLRTVLPSLSLPAVSY